MKYIKLLTVLIGLASGITACGSNNSSSTATASARGSNSIVGAWLVTVPLQVSGSIMSFRDDGTMRMLLPASDDDLRDIKKLPAAERNEKMKHFVVQGGQTYGNAPGTWSTPKADVIRVVMGDGGDRENFDYTVRLLSKNNIELLREGDAPMMLQYLNLPLPRE